MSLADLDRPVITMPYEPWGGAEVKFRKMSAKQLLELSACAPPDDELESATPGPKGIAFYAKLLSMSIVEPSFDVDTWMSDATTLTLCDLGQKALEVNGLGGAKKN